jgi:hypothetical protein
MPPITTWNIYMADGRYLGQASGFAPHTAFCRFMSVSGRQVAETDIHFEDINNDSGRIVYETEEFVLSSQGAEIFIPAQ